MTTPTELVNSALRKVGGKRILDINDSIASAGVASDILANERDSLLRSGTWNFATTRADLAPLATAPVWGFTNAFAVPSDYMRMISVHDSTGRRAPEAEYKLESILQEGEYIMAILADPDQLWIRYVRRVEDVNMMSADFQDCLITSMAMVFAVSIAKSAQLYATLAGELAAMTRAAKSTDGIEDMIDQMDEGSWSRSRRGWGRSNERFNWVD